MSIEDMRKLEENTEFLGVPRLKLMENAGRASYEVLKDKVRDKRVRKSYNNPGILKISTPISFKMNTEKIIRSSPMIQEVSRSRAFFNRSGSPREVWIKIAE